MTGYNEKPSVVDIDVHNAWPYLKFRMMNFEICLDLTVTVDGEVAAKIHREIGNWLNPEEP